MFMLCGADSDVVRLINLDTLEKIEVTESSAENLEIRQWNENIFCRDKPDIIINEYDGYWFIWYKKRLIRLSGIVYVLEVFEEYERLVVRFSSMFFPDKLQVFINNSGCFGRLDYDGATDYGICTRNEARRRMLFQ